MVIDCKFVRTRTAIIRAMCDEIDNAVAYGEAYKREQDKAREKVDASDAYDRWWIHMPVGYQAEPDGMGYIKRRAMMIREEALSLYTRHGGGMEIDEAD